MRRVILDSNFLFIPFQFRIDIIEELESLTGKLDVVVLSTTVEELERLSRKGSDKTKRRALAALKLTERCTVVNVERGPTETYDDVILRKAKEWKCAAATNDRELRKRLRKEIIPVIYLRQKQRLELEGYI
jgi:rRNA-processing protein FCF1